MSERIDTRSPLERHAQDAHALFGPQWQEQHSKDHARGKWAHGHVGLPNPPTMSGKLGTSGVFYDAFTRWLLSDRPNRKYPVTKRRLVVISFDTDGRPSEQAIEWNGPVDDASLRFAWAEETPTAYVFTVVLKKKVVAK